MDATPAMKEYAEKKISKIQKYFKSDSEAFVTFSTERGRYIAEVTIKNKTVHAFYSPLSSNIAIVYLRSLLKNVFSTSLHSSSNTPDTSSG